jgi:hypothetical protein
MHRGKFVRYDASDHIDPASYTATYRAAVAAGG